MWEIAENLYRAELTTLEPSEQIAEWLRLSKEVLTRHEPNADTISSQLATKTRGRPKGGTSDAAREIRFDRDAALRAEKIDSLPDEDKEAAVEHGLDNNQSASREEPHSTCSRVAAVRNTRKADCCDAQ